MTHTQRAHRLGTKRRPPNSKPRPLIARFISYKKRNKFMHSKANLKDRTKFKEAFIVKI